MKCIKRKRFKLMAGRGGFTLIEIIVTIVISAVLAVILAQVVSSQTARSYVPVEVLKENLALRAAMENISADYTRLRNLSPNPLAVLRSNIDTPDTYWEATPADGPAILAEFNDCVAIGAIESKTTADCTNPDSVLKVTLQSQDHQQRLTALFTQTRSGN